MPGRINIYAPSVSLFPELKMLRGCGIQDRIECNVDAVELSTVAALEEHDESSPHFLYVIDAKGQLLEHVRYYGDDYRAALSKAFLPTNTEGALQ